MNDFLLSLYEEKQANKIVFLVDNAAAHPSLLPRAQMGHDEKDVPINCISPLMKSTERCRQTKLAQQSSPLKCSHTLSLISSPAEHKLEYKEVDLSSPVRVPSRSFDRWEGASSPDIRYNSPIEPPRLYLPCRWENEFAASGSDALSSPRLPMRRKRIARKITMV